VPEAASMNDLNPDPLTLPEVAGEPERPLNGLTYCVPCWEVMFREKWPQHARSSKHRRKTAKPKR